MLLQFHLAPPTWGLAAAAIGTPGEGDAEDGEQSDPLICIANIGPRQRRQRLNFGVWAFALSLAALALMVVFRLDIWWRLPLFVTFALATSGYYQWRDHT